MFTPNSTTNTAVNTRSNCKIHTLSPCWCGVSCAVNTVTWSDCIFHNMMMYRIIIVSKCSSCPRKHTQTDANRGTYMQNKNAHTQIVTQCNSMYTNTRWSFRPIILYQQQPAFARVSAQHTQHRFEEVGCWGGFPSNWIFETVDELGFGDVAAEVLRKKRVRMYWISTANETAWGVEKQTKKLIQINLRAKVAAKHTSWYKTFHQKKRMKTTI